MRHRLVASVLSTILASAIGATAHGAPAPATPAPKSPTKTLKAVPNFTTVTDQALRAPRPSDWVMYRGNYQGWGYSPLEQINKTNVRTLQLAWSRVMARRATSRASDWFRVCIPTFSCPTCIAA